MHAPEVRLDREGGKSPWEHDPEVHYDRIMPAWRLLMGRNLHYGCFEAPDEDLDAATDNLTRRLAKHARLNAGLDVLDVGCGDGQNSCFLAERFGCRVTGISTGKKGVERARELSRARALTRQVAFRLRDGMDNGFPAGPLPMVEIVRHREEFLLLHRVFGRAKMEPLETYRSLAEESGLRVDVLEDLSAQTLPTFDGWRLNAHAHRDRVIELVGETLWREFLSACDVLETFWKQGRFGYGMLAGVKL